MRMYLVICIALKLNLEIISLLQPLCLVDRIERGGVTAVTVLLLYILTETSLVFSSAIHTIL